MFFLSRNNSSDSGCTNDDLLLDIIRHEIDKNLLPSSSTGYISDKCRKAADFAVYLISSGDIIQVFIRKGNVTEI